MNHTRKFQFILAIISICILSPLLIAKSSEGNTKLKFEIDNKISQRWLSGRNRSGQGPIKPTHVAILHIRRPHKDMPSGDRGILEILKTSAGQTLSKQQRNFLSASDAINWWGIVDIKNHDNAMFTITHCPTLEALEREGEGREKEICRIVEPVVLKCYASFFNLDIEVKGLKMPPRKSKDGDCCQWEFTSNR